MVSLRFPFPFFLPPNPQPPNATSANISSSSSGSFPAAWACAAGIAAGIAVLKGSTDPFLQNPFNSLLSNLVNRNHLAPMLGSISLSDNGSAPVTESRTGMSFPSVLGDSQRLLGVGLRRKCILGLKNIDVYAFGVYADDSDIKKVLTEKYGNLSVSELKESKKLQEDLMESDVSMTVRLQIVYGKLSIKSVRSAFEESVGSRLKKYGGGADHKELLQRFTSQFKDEYKIPRGSIIDLSREQGYVLRTKIDGKEVGSIESKLLCRSILDLYIGDEPFDQKAKEDVQQNLASLFQK